MPAHAYRVEGFGEDFISSTMDFSVVDDDPSVGQGLAFSGPPTRQRGGDSCRGSSGGAVCAAVRYAEKTGFKGNIVVIICDSAVRYLSKIFSDTRMKEGGYLEPEIGEETVGDMLRSRLYTADQRLTRGRVLEVIDQMKTHGISQSPVIGCRPSDAGLDLRKRPPQVSCIE